MFGLENIGKQSVEEAHKTVNEAITKLDPLLNNLFTRLTFLCHDLLDRFEIDIKIKLNPVKARAANPAPDKEY